MLLARIACPMPPKEDPPEAEKLAVATANRPPSALDGLPTRARRASSRGSGFSARVPKSSAAAHEPGVVAKVVQYSTYYGR